MAAQDARTAMLNMVFGFRDAQIIYVAARLGLADLLADGPRSSADLAKQTDTHQPSLYRLLRALAILGAVAEVERDRFELTETGRPLRADVPGSVRGLVMLFGGEEVWRTWGELLYSVRTGKYAWEHVTGQRPFDYFAGHPELSATFNKAMSEGTRAAAPDLIKAYDFARFTTLVDVGGGDGTLIAEILAAAPSLRGVLYDLPAGLEHADRTLAAAGVAGRCQVVGGDFFESVPAGADAYLLKSVIHDWDDDQATAILRRCREAVPPDGTLLVVEPILPPTIDSTEAAGTVMSDLNMLVATGGRERTEEEFRALLAAAGFTMTSLTGPLWRANYRIMAAAPTDTH
ncbi:MAG TPA: methyltransferase [Streptosporangiaceae bacterium]|jgi:hypothetical protein